MDQQPEDILNKKKGNGNIELTVKKTEEVKLSAGDKEDDDLQQQYQEQLKEYHDELKRWKKHVQKLNEEFANLLTRSQDIFEKQLSYIASGALGLSVGFINNIVDLKTSTNKWMLVSGWGLLIVTLLLNLISHMVAASDAKKGKTETNNEKLFDDRKINKRSEKMVSINWATVIMLASGIMLIVLYITLNTIYGG